jgi:UDP-GlcNAc:undecaprenyl-phosphate GlcNAc-1-phosphate transferase
MVLLFLVLMIPYVRRYFLDVGYRWLFMLLLSFTVSFCLTPVFGWLAHRLNILDRPGSRKLHTMATPLLGGSAVFIAFLTVILINGIFSLKLWCILGAAVLIFAVSLADDCREISAGLKLLVQIACSAFVICFGIVLKVVPENLGLVAQLSNIFLTLIWIVGITNAMNFFDGMDGLAAGLGAIISLFLGGVAFQTEQPLLGWIAVAMLGSCLGFLPYNFRKNGKASIFLGDSGSTVIGFILACVAVYGDWAETSPMVALTSPLLIFWVLIFDMIYITVDRILTGKVLSLRQWIEYVGRDHLHHRIAYTLGGQKKSVLFIYLLSFCLGASALLIRNAQFFDAILLLVQASIFVVLITILERRGRTLAMENGLKEPS